MTYETTTNVTTPCTLRVQISRGAVADGPDRLALDMLRDASTNATTIVVDDLTPEQTRGLLDAICRDKGMPTYTNRVAAAAHNANDMFAARRELDEFKQRVIDTTVEWEKGCDDGKREFLDMLDLEWPAKEYRVEVVFTTGARFDTDDLESAVSNAVEQEIDGDIDIDWTTCEER